ncbi:hypothetical protein B23_1040 [Geobacillus thermoleovorans B23]|nr:hypothetical protein B23_1040 [Geobacillus thermoleovorans B23]
MKKALYRFAVQEEHFFSIITNLLCLYRFPSSSAPGEGSGG